MLEFINRFERLVYMLLIGLLVIVLIFALGEMFWYLWVSVTNTPIGLLENHELTSVLGTFLLVLIAVELLDTMKAYIEDNVIHVEIVVLLAIIAIARKVIPARPRTDQRFRTDRYRYHHYRPCRCLLSHEESGLYDRDAKGKTS